MDKPYSFALWMASSDGKAILLIPASRASNSSSVFPRCLAQPRLICVFGKSKAGAHFVVGMGETEREMCEAIQKTRDMGGKTHLFSYFPEEGSAMNGHQPSPMDQYRRIQLARYLIDEEICRSNRFTYSDKHEISDYGLPRAELDAFIDRGEPFRTSGCSGYDGEVACNRPYGNSRPGPDIRNFPFPAVISDISRIRKQMRLEKGE